MSFRGRGRGRGRFGGFRQISTPKPFILYPEINSLPCPGKPTDEAKTFARLKYRLESYWKSSPYHLGDGTIKSDPFENADPERFSDKVKSKDKYLLVDFLQPSPAHFPEELVGASKEWSRKKRKKVQWDTGIDLTKFDMFEKLELKEKGEEDEADAKKEGEEEDEEAIEEDDGEYSDNGDYDQNVDFDDDEDDFNVADDDDGEGAFE